MGGTLESLSHGEIMCRHILPDHFIIYYIQIMYSQQSRPGPCVSSEFANRKRGLRRLVGRMGPFRKIKGGGVGPSGEPGVPAPS